MSNDKQNKNQPDDRSTLDRRAQEEKIRRQVEDSKRHMPKRKAESEDDQEDWSWGDVDFGQA